MSFVNASNSSCPSIAEEKISEKALKTLAYSLVIFVSLLGNTLVIAIVYKKPKMRTITNYQIVNMSVADILITVAAMPAIIYQIYRGNRWPFGLLPCKLAAFLQGLSVSCSVFTMTCISIERFCTILFPYKKLINQRRCAVMIILCWIFSIILQAPTLHAMKLRKIEDRTICVEHWKPHFDDTTSLKIYTVILFVAMCLLPLLIIAILYTAISYFLWKRKTPGSGVSKARKDRSRATKVIRMLVIIVVVFAVCWLPIFVKQFVGYFAQPQCGVSPRLSFLGFFFSHTNSAINPLVYWIFNGTFRQGFKALLRLCFMPWSTTGRRVAIPSNDVEMM